MKLDIPLFVHIPINMNLNEEVVREKLPSRPSTIVSSFRGACTNGVCNAYQIGVLACDKADISASQDTVS